MKNKYTSLNVLFFLYFLFGLFSSLLFAQPDTLHQNGNTRINTFHDAKKYLRKIYADRRVSFYCLATFNEHLAVTLPAGFATPRYEKRAYKIEWEHLVPAENFGRAFVEWREGDPACQYKGKSFKGRNCAEKVNQRFRFMLCDMHNLVPAIGAVNAARSNFDFSPLPGDVSRFGSCQMKIEGKKVEPPVYTRGSIGRAYLYMEATYSEFRMSKATRLIMKNWADIYPPDLWECERNHRIAQLQGNSNPFIDSRCH